MICFSNYCQSAWSSYRSTNMCAEYYLFRLGDPTVQILFIHMYVCYNCHRSQKFYVSLAENARYLTPEMKSTNSRLNYSRKFVGRARHRPSLLKLKFVFCSCVLRFSSSLVLGGLELKLLGLISTVTLTSFRTAML